jgi:hypothetical protein
MPVMTLAMNCVNQGCSRHTHKSEFFGVRSELKLLLLSTALCNLAVQFADVTWRDVSQTATVKGRAFPLQAWAGPWGSRRLRLLIFLTFGTMKVVRSSALRTGRLYPQEFFRYSFLEAQSTPGRMVPSVASEEIPSDTAETATVDYDFLGVAPWSLVDWQQRLGYCGVFPEMLGPG